MQLYAMSMPFSSTSTGMPPSDVTQSAMTSASTSCAASQIGFAWLNMPVDVSACTNATTCGPLAADELARLLRVEGLAPGLREADDFRALAARHLADAVAEEAVGEEREFAAGLGEVGDGGFHAGAAGAGERHVELVLRRERISEQRADFIRDLEEERVEMADHRLRHGLVDARRHHDSDRGQRGGASAPGVEDT